MGASLRTGSIACGLNSVPAIMPEGIGSGKTHQRDSHAVGMQSTHFPQSGMAI
jgi:hypothetical protein